MISEFFVVKGGSGDYQIELEIRGKNVSMWCTCKAGSFGQYCKHRFALLGGDDRTVIQGDKSFVATLPDLIRGSDVALAMEEVAAAEKVVANARKRLSAYKRKLARVLQD